MALDNPYRTSDDEPSSANATPPRGNTELLAGAEFLPCGRPLGRAWEQVRAPVGTPDPHSSHCPYCREAIEGLEALDRATRALRAKQQPDGLHLANRVINAVRAEVRLGTMLLVNAPQPDVRIAESAAAKVLRRAADTVPGARTANCRLTSSKDGHAVHMVAITVAAMLDRPLPERAEAVRQAVLQAAEHVLGLAVAAVDVEVNAVLEPPRVPEPARSEQRRPRRAGQQP